MTQIVVDSSSLITISGNCFINLLKHLTEQEKISFLMPESVYYESVQKPVKIKRFELNAIRIRDCVEEGYLKLIKTTPSIKRTMEELSTVSANIYNVKGKNFRLIDLGEAETLALMKEINSELLLIDERTTRMLIEEPQNVLEFLQRRHRCNVEFDHESIQKFSDLFGKIKIIRSVELIALSYENGCFAKEMHKTKQALEAALYAAKFAGCAVSFEEIKGFLKNVRN